MSEAGKAVFLSYASQDAEAARRICESLRSGGVEVWFDADGGLEHGDEWDAKIRRQIKECVLFIPVISASTQARHEGYFRIEWELAAQRAMGIASGVPFILPVVIDDTREPDALVPERFRAVQWTKLRGGEVPPEVQARYLKLWSHRMAFLKDEAANLTRASSPPFGFEASGTPVKPEVERRVPTALWLGAAVVAVSLFIVIAWPWKKPEPPVAAKSGNEARSPVAENASSRDEAGRLMVRAREIFENGDEGSRETYALSEELLKRVVALDPTDAEAWALQAQISGAMILFAFDTSPARRDAVRMQAERALSLAPESVSAQLAYAGVQLIVRQDLPGADRQLRALAERDPQNWRVLRTLGQLCVLLGKVDEAAEVLQRARRVSGDHPAAVSDLVNLFVNASRLTDAEKAIEQIDLGRAGTRVLVFDTHLKLLWRGDTAAAAASLNRWPAWLRLEDRGTLYASLVALWSREPKKALAVVRRYPRDYIRDSRFTGPVAVLSAWAHEQSGNAEAARADWASVLKLTERELATTPNDAWALYWKTWALARLGNSPAAEMVLSQVEQREGSGFSRNFATGGASGLFLTLGQTDKAIADLRGRLEKNARGTLGTRLTRAALELNPQFDSIRADAKFQALVSSAYAPEATAAQPTEKK